jgi:hypothetical protein
MANIERYEDILARQKARELVREVSRTSKLTMGLSNYLRKSSARSYNPTNSMNTMNSKLMEVK